MVYAGVVYTSAGGACSFAVDARVAGCQARLRGGKGGLRRAVPAPLSLVLPTPVLSEVPSRSWPNRHFHRAPQGPQWWHTGCRIPWALANRNFALQGLGAQSPARTDMSTGPPTSCLRMLATCTCAPAPRQQTRAIAHTKLYDRGIVRVHCVLSGPEETGAGGVRAAHSQSAQGAVPDIHRSMGDPSLFPC